MGRRCSSESLGPIHRVLVCHMKQHFELCLVANKVVVVKNLYSHVLYMALLDSLVEVFWMQTFSKGSSTAFQRDVAKIYYTSLLPDHASPGTGSWHTSSRCTNAPLAIVKT